MAKRTAKIKYEILVDQDGHIINGPDDHFFQYSKNVFKWITDESKIVESIVDSDRNSYIKQRLNNRYILFLTAYNLYHNLNTNEELICAPRVIVNYIPNEDCNGNIVLYFIFKESNNGTTYRVKCWSEHMSDIFCMI